MLPGLVVFVSGLMWASVRDPYKRVEFSVRTNLGGIVKCLGILPKPNGQRPTVILLHGADGNLLDDGDYLRRFAEFGLNAISFEYNPNSEVNFEERFAAVIFYVKARYCARNADPSWVGLDLGAERALRYLMKRPDQQPSIYVGVAHNWGREFYSIMPSNITCQIVMLQYRNTDLFRAQWIHGLHKWERIADRTSLQSGSESGPAPVLPVMIRAVAEYCANYFTLVEPLRGNATSLHVAYWLPSLALLICFLGHLCLHSKRSALQVRDPYPRLTNAVFKLTLVIFSFVTITAGIVVILINLPVSKTSLWFGRNLLASATWREEFDLLATNSLARRGHLRLLLDNAELASYNRRLVNWGCAETLYRNYVLSPVIEPASAPELDWRRDLWEALYPRIRRESDMTSAAKIVVCFLRERVTVSSIATHNERGIDAMWRFGLSDAAGFESLYVAALRAVGIPARLNHVHRTEMWNGNAWQLSPRPPISTWKDLIAPERSNHFSQIHIQGGGR